MLAQLVKKFPAFMETKAHYCVHKNPPADLIVSHIISLRSVLVLCYLRQRLPSVFFPSGYPTKILYAFFISLTYAPSPAHPILTVFDEEYKL